MGPASWLDNHGRGPCPSGLASSLSAVADTWEAEQEGEEGNVGG